jgi:DNA-binding NarL/FixJ family response regulator
MISVVVADDQAVVRDGLILLLSASDEIDVVGAAADGPEAVALIEQAQPQVALLDLRMPGLSGAEVTAELAMRSPTTRALILTTYADDDAVLPALRAGAAGYLTKDATGETLLHAIREVAAGRTVLDAAVQRRLVEMVTGPPVPTVTVAPTDSAAPSPAQPAFTYAYWPPSARTRVTSPLSVPSRTPTPASPAISSRSLPPVGIACR